MSATERKELQTTGVVLIFRNTEEAQAVGNLVKQAYVNLAKAEVELLSPSSTIALRLDFDVRLTNAALASLESYCGGATAMYRALRS
jgi:hypothetical protein